VTSQVQCQTGVQLDVETLSRELAARGVWHVVNCTRSAGVVPLAVVAKGFTAVTATAVKWLYSGLGTGIVYLSDAMRQETRLPVAGWLAQRDPFAMIAHEVPLKSDTSELETGATGVVRLLALGANLALMNEAGLHAIHARVLALNAGFLTGIKALGEEVLTPRDDRSRAGFFSVRHGQARDWSAWAKTQGVLHSVRGSDVVRLSCHYFNTEVEVDRVLAMWPLGPKSR